jgi:hypothetical protein
MLLNPASMGAMTQAGAFRPPMAQPPVAMGGQMAPGTPPQGIPGRMYAGGPGGDPRITGPAFRPQVANQLALANALRGGGMRGPIP